MLIDEVLGRWDFREVHTLVVPAPPQTVWEAAQALEAGDVPVARILMAVRTLPGLARRRGGPRPAPRPRSAPRTLREAMAGTFVPLAELPGRETVSGAAGQWWKPAAPFVRLAGPEEFHSFRTPGHLRAAVNLRVTPHPRGALLHTETRVVAVDPRTRRVFAPYWYLLARPFGGLIRRAALRAVARRALAAEPAPGA
ncbi:hypothetical protein AB0O18_14795 [Streptomyces sp. NPDC093224]|uniref:hypothetical protein n=1 Tax=unclassified Streptomyces TaxID=2593676 RepID=UPI00342DC0D2